MKILSGHVVINMYVCVERIVVGFLTFIFDCMCVPVLMFVCACVQISERCEVLCWLWRSMGDLAGRRKGQSYTVITIVHYNCACACMCGCMCEPISSKKKKKYIKHGLHLQVNVKLPKVLLSEEQCTDEATLILDFWQYILLYLILNIFFSTLCVLALLFNFQGQNNFLFLQ